MKSKFKLLGALAATICLSGNAWGYMIGTTDVGGLDDFIAETDDLPGPGSSQAAETNWVNLYVDPDTTFNIKTETVSYSLVDGETSIYAFALQSDPGYFVIKNTSDNWALFQNNASTDWGVIDLSVLADLEDWNLGGEGQLTISHVTEFGSSTTVPEPATLGLFSLGLLGLGFASRRRKAN